MIEIYHRDIKPDNAFYQINVQDIKIKIGDFSSIKIKKNDQFSCITEEIGSPFYKSPEYDGWDGDENNIDLEKCDVYSLGVTFIEILYAPNILNEKIFQKEKYEQQFEDFKRLVNNDELINFLLQMVDEDYKKRPRVQDVMNKIVHLIQN
ncbi:Protein kinase-like domain [Pseudocohnilembus persalinus]|uniref:non-specific serine/threonine protein kinase n=1 Tax=Pseudocohnilembus persalinus TaxID=266149 RepID=A0A0V0QM19_PSEPJ|nr:Protein kinase-like domain [Pseudocohnilembus persalinus]|eukprot:KRX03128.1 Protein kinase-like domain [Pseudocohnilembus persalinus]